MFPKTSKTKRKKKHKRTFFDQVIFFSFHSENRTLVKYKQRNTQQIFGGSIEGGSYIMRSVLG